MSSVALTFFAFLGFGVVTFTAKDLAQPAKQLPTAMFIAIGLATVIYVAVAIGVFGTLTVPEVIAAGPTAIAVAAQPVLGDAGYWLMTVTALFATAGATNSGLYPATGLSDHLAASGQFPSLMARRLGGRAPYGLIILAVAVIIVVIAFDLSAVASIGSAVALVIFGGRDPRASAHHGGHRGPRGASCSWPWPPWPSRSRPSRSRPSSTNRRR